MDELEQAQVPENGEPMSLSSVGGMLREARDAKGISIVDAARQLKLGARQLEALEAEDFAKLPGPTFVRGFIRNYAKLLGADPAPLLEAYQSTGPQTPTQVIASQDDQVSFSEHPKSHFLRYGLVLVAAVLVAGYALYEWSPLKGDRQVPSAGEPAAMALPHPEGAPLPAEEAAKPGPAPLSAPAEPSVPVAPVSAAPAPVTAPSQANLPALTFSFSGDSWVEIRDHDGKIIFSQLNHANTQQTVQGNPPFDLVIGNAPAVKLNYKSKPVDLSAFTRSDVARIKLD